MAKRLWTTPETVYKYEREQELKQADSIRNNLDKHESIDYNIKTFKKGVHHNLESLYKLEADIEEKKADISRKVKNEMITEKLGNQDIKELDEKYMDMRVQTNARLTDLFNDFNNAFTNKYKLSSKNIDDSDMKLLKSTIKLTKEELQELITKHKENETMIRAIQGYADDKNILISIPVTNEEKLQQVKLLQDRIKLGLEAEDKYAHSRMHLTKEEYRETLMDNYLKHLYK